MSTRSTRSRSVKGNKQGVIVEHYAELQAIPLLDAARKSFPLPTASQQSAIRAIFQAVEIAILNINDLLERAQADLIERDIEKMMAKLSWVRGFHAVLIELSTMPTKFSTIVARSQLHIIDSPAFQSFAYLLREFDKKILASINSGTLEAEILLSNGTQSNAAAQLLHLIQVCNHETSIWEYNLADISIPIEIPSYMDLVRPDIVKDAVYDTVLHGDTFYTQFRGLHQIPEILTFEINDHLESAILDLRQNALQSAYQHMQLTNVLLFGVLASLPPIIDNLTTSDYHMIRENLGLTSGSHSVNIHFHLFRDLYRQISLEFNNCIVRSQDTKNEDGAIQAAIRFIEQERFQQPELFLIHIIGDELLQLHAFTSRWRDEHLHLPRINVGGHYTKSLTGSPDAVQTVKGMRDAAETHDPLEPLLQARGIYRQPQTRYQHTMAAYFNDPVSLDQYLLGTIGGITKRRFKQVQERTGIFADKPPFVPPPPREV